MEFVNTTNDGKIIFKSDGREHTRKLNKDKEFKFENETYFYHYSFSMGYGSTARIYKVTEDLKKTLWRYSDLGWQGVDLFLGDLAAEYSNKEGETSHIPAGPDTTKFTATVSGFIRPQARPSTVGQSHYSCGKYYHRALQIGGNARADENLFRRLRYVLPRLSKPLGYNGSDSKVTYGETLGTNFSTYGIG